MVERTLVVILIAGALIVGWRLAGLWHGRRVRRARLSPVLPELAPLLKPGRPTVLAFSTPGCAECRARQRPALQQLHAQMGETVHIAEVSAPDHPALVSHFGILTAPATAILDPAGAVQHVNLRYTSAERLQAQLEALAPHVRAA